MLFRSMCARGSCVCALECGGGCNKETRGNGKETREMGDTGKWEGDTGDGKETQEMGRRHGRWEGDDEINRNGPKFYLPRK